MSTRRKSRSFLKPVMTMILAIMVVAIYDVAYACDDNTPAPTCHNALYLIDNTANGDGKSEIYQVNLNRRVGVADLTHVTTLPYDRAHIALDKDCRHLYAVRNGNVRLGFYDLVHDRFSDLGSLDIKGVTQAAFNLDGELFIGSSRTNKLYTVDTTTLALTAVGKVVQPNGQPINIQGADLVFTPDEAMYVMTRHRGNSIFEVEAGTANLETIDYINGIGSKSTGLAFDPSEPSLLVYSERKLDQMVLMDRNTGTVEYELSMQLDSAPFDALNGDMAVVPCGNDCVTEEPGGEEDPGGEEEPGEGETGSGVMPPG